MNIVFIPLRIVPNVSLSLTNVKLFAANGTKISVLGSVRLYFKVEKLKLFADFLVSDDIDECILGFDWLKRNGCHWLFDRGVLEIGSTRAKLKKRPSRAAVRRIYAAESIFVEDGMQVNVPVKMPLSNLRSPDCDWLTEAKEIKPGLVMARTLLPNMDQNAAVRVINLSGKNQKICQGTFLSRAEPGHELRQVNCKNTTLVSDDNLRARCDRPHQDATESTVQLVDCIVKKQL